MKKVVVSEDDVRIQAALGWWGQCKKGGAGISIQRKKNKNTEQNDSGSINSTVYHPSIFVLSRLLSVVSANYPEK